MSSPLIVPVCSIKGKANILSDACCKFYNPSFFFLPQVSHVLARARVGVEFSCFVINIIYLIFIHFRDSCNFSRGQSYN